MISRQPRLNIISKVMGTANGRETIAYSSLVDTVFESLTVIDDSGKIVVDLVTLTTHFNNPIRIYVDVNVDDYSNITQMMYMDILQDVITDSDEVEKCERLWIRQRFRYIKEDQQLTGVQLEAVNEGIRRANATLAAKYKN